MANGQGSIDEIIGSQAIKGLDDSIAKMEALNKEFAAIVPLIKSMNSALGNSKSIKDLTTAINEQNQAAGSATKIVKEYTAAIAEDKLKRQELRKEIDLAVQQKKAEVGSIDALRLELKSLQKQYSALGEEARKALGPDLLRNIQNTHVAVTKLEQSMGQYSRNVGNYKNQTFQLTQVLREVPAFTYSATTGILALSNNLPMLADGFQSVAKATNEATGKVNGTMGALKIFGSSLLSFGSIFSIAIGLFTIFSKEIFEFFSNTKQADEATKALGESVGRESGKYETLTRILNNHNLSKEDHIRAAKELKDLYPQALANYNAEEIAAGKAAAAIRLIGAAIIANARAKAAQADVDKKAAELFGIQGELETKKAELEIAKKTNEQLLKQTQQINRNDNYYNLLIERANNSTKAVNDLKDEIEELTKQSAELDDQMNKTASTIATTSKGTDILGGGGGGGKSTGSSPNKTGTAPKKTGAALQELQFQKMEINLEYFRGDLSPEQIKSAQDAINKLRVEAEKASKDNPIKITWDFQYKVSDFFAKLEPIAQQVNALVSDTTKGVSEISQVVLDNQLAVLEQREKRLKSYYDNELRFIEQSGFSSAKKEKMKQKLQAETEAKQKQIDRDRITAMRKAAQIQRGIDIANVISTTALAIMKAWAEGDPWSKPFRALAAGFAGAAQLARVIATPLPQYAKGRKGGKQEWAVVGEQGSEIISHNGTMQLTPNKPTLTLLPEGADVIPHHEAIKNAAYIHLSKQGQITTDKLQAALIEKFDQYHEDNLVLQSILRSKDFKYNHKDLSGYEAWRQTKVR